MGRKKLDFQVCHLRKERVRQILRKCVYDDVSLAGWGHLVELMAMVMGLGIYEILERIKGQIKGDCYIPRLVIYPPESL